MKKKKNADMEMRIQNNIDYLTKQTDFLFKAFLWICLFGFMGGVCLLIIFLMIIFG